jgi:hypothetical protein
MSAMDVQESLLDGMMKETGLPLRVTISELAMDQPGQARSQDTALYHSSRANLETSNC